VSPWRLGGRGSRVLGNLGFIRGNPGDCSDVQSLHGFQKSTVILNSSGPFLDREQGAEYPETGPNMGLIVFPFAQRPVGRDSRVRNRVRPLAPRVAPAAVRVPDPRHIHVEIPFPAGRPQIFVHEGARQLLERRLSLAAMRPVMLSVTDNRRSMIAFEERDGIVRARLHHMFLDAPSRVQSALVRYIAHGSLVSRVHKETAAQAAREASLLVGRYIEENSHRIRAARPFLRPLCTQGQHHDVLSIFKTLNDKYFGGTVDALVTWGRVGRRGVNERGTGVAPRRTVKLGSYSAVERLIRLHPVLDRPWVPRYFVSFILYHEMLHHVIPPVLDGKRRILHPPHFVEREQLFRDYERALAWERTHIHRVLRARV
jgi:hypothetical protein